MSDVVILAPNADLISAEVDNFKQKIVEALAGKPSKIVLDLSQVVVIDSSGIGTLIAAKNSASNSNCEVVLKQVNSDIMKMFKIMRLTDHFVFEN